MKIVVGQGSCGIAAGAAKTYEAICALIQEQDGIELGSTGCNGMCFLEPIVDIYEGHKLLKRLVNVSAEKAPLVVDAVRSGDLDKASELFIQPEDEAFLTQQTRIALRNCGIIDPVDNNSYRERDGYKALEKVLTTMTPEQVIEEIKVSGLAGRGGAGFPTWFKWNAARSSPGEEKYLICNADEGDPGAFMDCAVIESDPHNLIEGMMIAAYDMDRMEKITAIRCAFDEAGTVEHIK